jgi:hypothetical protein
MTVVGNLLEDLCDYVWANGHVGRKRLKRPILRFPLIPSPQPLIPARVRPRVPYAQPEVLPQFTHL